MARASESSVLADITENLLQCAICQSEFLKPKVLSCQHSFCAKCLKGWHHTRRTEETNYFSCPVCRKNTILPDLGVDGLPENYVIKELVSLVKPKDSKPSKKSVCKKKPKAKPVVALKRRRESGASNQDAGPSTSKKVKATTAKLEPTSEGSSDDSLDESGEGSVVTTTLPVGMKVYVFSKLGNRYKAIIKMKNEAHTYVGIKLRREHSGLAAGDLQDIEGYLDHWVDENDNTCTMVRADACLPVAMAKHLQES